MKTLLQTIYGKLKTIIGCCLLGSLAYSSNAQLLSNAGFETYTTCPTTVSQTSYATGWFAPTGGTSDYFNSCGFLPTTVPFTNKNVTAAYGNGFAGFYTDATSIDYKNT